MRFDLDKLQRPGQIPDLRPTEHFQNKLKRLLQARSPCPTVYYNLTDALLTKLVQIIAALGAAIDYCTLFWKGTSNKLIQV